MQHLLNIWKLACGFRKFKLTLGKVDSEFNFFLLKIFSVLDKPIITGLSLAGGVYCFTGWKVCYKLMPVICIGLRVVCSVLLS